MNGQLDAGDLFDLVYSVLRGHATMDIAERSAAQSIGHRATVGRVGGYAEFLIIRDQRQQPVRSLPGLVTPSEILVPE